MQTTASRFHEDLSTLLLVRCAEGNHLKNPEGAAQIRFCICAALANLR